MKRILLAVLTVCIFFPLAAQADPLSDQLERIMFKIVNPQKPTYYVPLIQISEEEPAPTADGAEAGVFYVEIGGTYTADGYEPEFFSLMIKETAWEEKDGPCGILFEEINPSIFNEAYRRFASNPRSVKATIDETRKMLTKYYRSIQAERQKKK